VRIQLTRQRVTNVIALLVLCATWFVIGWVVRSRRLGPDVVLIEQVRQHLLSEYPNELPASRQLTYAAIRGMIRQTDDPYTALFEPVVSQRFLADFAGQTGIIGLFPEVQNGELVVSVVLPGEPADRAGLRLGDVVLSVDGVEFTEDTTVAEAALLLRGPVGTPAHVVVRRGDEILEFDPIRQARPIVSAQMLDSQIAYISQHTFTLNAAPKMKESLEDLLRRHPRGVIWDLRSNGGGSMNTARDILSYFIGDGLLFTAQLKGGKQKEYMAEGDAIAPDVPLVVLVGEHTYSAAETAAVAVQERGRGILIGNTTYGKGLIQTTVPLVENCMLHMTIAKWLSPTGEWYGERGVTPDFVVTDDDATEEDEVLQFAVDYILQHETPEPHSESFMPPVNR
jgi:carboxyl-terminal processing protease